MATVRVAAILAVSLGLLQAATSAVAAGADVEHSIPVQVTSSELVRQGRAVVTEIDLATHVDRIPEEEQSSFLYSRDRLDEALRALLQPRLITAFAQEQGFLDDPKVQGKLYQSSVEFIAREFMRHYRRDRELEDYRIQAREVYLTDPERFRTSRRYDFGQIFIAPGRERGELEAMRKVIDVFDRLLEGESFEELSKEFPQSPEHGLGSGSLEGVELDEIDDTVAETLTLMSPGQFSEPVRSEFGWHILSLDAVHEREQMSFEEAQPLAEDIARRRHMERVTNNLMGDLTEPERRLRPENLAAFLEQYGIVWEGFETPDSE